MAYDEELAGAIREVLADADAVTEKRMFGGLAFLVGGHMAVAASGQGGLMVRCTPEETETLIGRPHAHPCVMRGRELVGWLRVDPGGVADIDDLRAWVDVGVAYARSLPAT